MAITTRGFDSPELYREDTLSRIEHLNTDIRGIVRAMNEIIREGNLPVDPVRGFAEVDEEDDGCGKRNFPSAATKSRRQIGGLVVPSST
ncbi:MAG: hypothetical protein HYU33_04970 [Candidatus Omnitrophica bacterium]|nr:hypothetical protein [Candidatus Omnitrophota bacterium]